MGLNRIRTCGQEGVWPTDGMIGVLHHHGGKIFQSGSQHHHGGIQLPEM